MSFKEEYKNCAEIMEPSAQQLERMKRNVLEQIKTPEKKAIPFKKIAYIGSAVAACAVLSIAAVNIIPRLSTGRNELAASSLTSSAELSYSEAGAGKFDMLTDGTGAAAENATINEAASEPATDDVLTDNADDRAAENDEESGATVAPSEEKGVTDNSVNGYDDDTNAPQGDSVSAPTTTAVDCGNVPEDTADMAVTDSSSTLEISDDMSMIAFDGAKYVLVDNGSAPPTDIEMYEIELLAHDGTHYYAEVYTNDYVILLLIDETGTYKIIGGYIKAE